MRKDNTTGITGVAKAKKSFRAYVTFRQNKFPLGNYKTIEEAAAARKKADDILLKTDISEEEMISELKKLHDRNLKIRKKDNVDITGQTFGKWYVIGPSKTKPYYHECKCQGCGIIRDVATSALRGGRTRSCHKCAVIGHSKTSSATAERMKKNAQEKIGKTINLNLFNKRFSYLNLLATSGILLVLFDPYVIFTLNFILGYFLSIIFLFILNITSNNKFFKRNIKKLTLQTFSLFPIQIYFTNSFNVLSIILQLLILPITNCVFLIGFVSFYLGYNPLLNYFCNCIYNLFKFLSNFNLALYHEPFSFVGLFFYYLVFGLLTYLFEYKIKFLDNKLIVSCFLIFIISSFPYKRISEKSVSFINVGQGDSILLRDKDLAILVDTGGNIYKDIANDVLINFFKKKEIYGIDYLFITHDDYDHIGALDELNKNFIIKNIYTKNNFNTTLIFNNISIQNLNVWNFDNSNDNSLVLDVDFYSNKFFLMGDVSTKVENKLIETYGLSLKADYLKLGHHGSNTSSSDEFIKIVSPKEAIISCGVNNIYNHPSKQVIDTLNKYKIKIRRTDLEGTISYYF